MVSSSKSQWIGRSSNGRVLHLGDRATDSLMDNDTWTVQYHKVFYGRHLDIWDKIIPNDKEIFNKIWGLLKILKTGYPIAAQL